ncbi:MAG: nickel-binding protein [bacterium]
MPRFLAVHAQAFSEEQLKALAANAGQLPPDVSWKRSYCTATGDRTFCDWEAPSREAVEQVLKANDLPFVTIYPVRRFDPAAGAFE